MEIKFKNNLNIYIYIFCVCVCGGGGGGVIIVINLRGLAWSPFDQLILEHTLRISP